MPEKKEAATLADIVKGTYVPEQYITSDDIEMVRMHFQGPQGDKLIKVIRKVLMPTAMDPELPIEQLSQDAWFASTDFSQISVNEALPRIIARQDTIKFILGGLVKIKIMANQKVETAEERAARVKKDSSK